MFVQQSIDAPLTGWLWYPPPLRLSPWKSHESSPASCHSASCPSQGDLPQGTATSFAFLRALHALVVLPQCYRGADPLGSRTLGAVRRRPAARVVDAGRLAGVGSRDAPAGRTGRTHHGGAEIAAAADAAFGAGGRGLAGRARAARRDAGGHLPRPQSFAGGSGPGARQRQGRERAEAHPSG